jgi:hypothetical protein
VGTLAGRANHHLRWLRPAAVRTVGRVRRDERDNGGGYTMHREWGRSTLRPLSGWRSLRWITPPPHATRTIPGHYRAAAGNWGMKILGLD